MIRHRAGRSSQRAALDRHPRRLAPPGRRLPGRTAAFTIIELLVVLAIIAAVVGGIGLALRGGDDTVALGSSQRTMSSLLTATRAQAIMKGTNARLIVHIDSSEPDQFLRKAGIIRWASVNGTDGWVPTSDGTSLPRGTYFVPASNASGIGDVFGESWETATDAYSVYPGQMNLTYPRLEGNDVLQTSGPRWAYYEFGPNGELTSGVSNLQIVLTTGTATQSTPVLENPDNVRGLILRRIGTFHLVDERLTFHGTD